MKFTSISLAASLLGVPAYYMGKNYFAKGQRDVEDNANTDANGAAFHPRGRDAAVMDLLSGARKSVLIRTDRLEMTEVATALANLVKGGVSVIVEMPERATLRQTDGALCRILADCGAVCRIGLDPTENYRGALIVVDGKTLYSASPLSYAPENAVRSYIMGGVKHENHP